jgi:hypothetical protein
MGVALWLEGFETRYVKNSSILFAHEMLVGHTVVTAESDLFAADNF